MCKNWENSAKRPTLRTSARATSAGMRNCLPVRQLAYTLVRSSRKKEGSDYAPEIFRRHSQFKKVCPQKIRGRNSRLSYAPEKYSVSVSASVTVRVSLV